ncbi:MAG: GNAT family N-acetyltransferase [Thermomicrobiales bacterium]|nr:GNAT family N-acetyltransferase [Thermomicrobiales bacterium]
MVFPSRWSLAGPSCYLRPPESQDAEAANRWEPRPIPASAQSIRQAIETAGRREPGQRLLLLICQRTNDRPAGSLRIALDGGRYARIEPAIDRLLPDDIRATLLSEALAATIAWLFDEYSIMTAAIHSADWQESTADALSQWPGRVAYRLREYRFVDGEYQDETVWQVFNPAWIARFGEPFQPEPVERLPIRRMRPAADQAEVRRPPNALAVGNRIYFRPFSSGEGAHVARSSMEEAEIYRPHGRAIRIAHNYEAFHSRLARQNPPYWARFAIALLETDELVGCTGLDMISWVHRHGTAEVEYFDVRHRGMGLGSESGPLLFNLGMHDMGLHSINAFVSESNVRSIEATRKRGYFQAGYLAWRTLGAHGPAGYYVFDMLNSEWNAPNHV